MVSWGYTGISFSVCLSVYKNTSFCQSAGRGIKSHLVTVLVLYLWLFLHSQCLFFLCISVYLWSPPVAHMSDTPKRWLVVTGIVQGYRTKLLRALPCSNVLGV